MAKIDTFTLLSPDPINFYSLKIYKPTLSDISKMGYGNFKRVSNLLMLNDIQISSYYEKQGIKNGELEPFLFLLQNSASDKTFFLEIQLAFFTYFKKQVLITKSGFFVDNDKKEKICISRDRFNEFQNIIRQINMNYDEDDEREIITDNLKMKQKFMEKRKLLRKTKEREKQRDQDNGKTLTLGQIISGLCTYDSGYNMTNVWNLTIYQLYDQFYRCQKREKYQNDYKALLAGADNNKIKLSYWIKD